MIPSQNSTAGRVRGRAVVGVGRAQQAVGRARQAAPVRIVNHATAETGATYENECVESNGSSLGRYCSVPTTRTKWPTNFDTHLNIGHIDNSRCTIARELTLVGIRGVASLRNEVVMRIPVGGFCVKRRF